MYELLGQERRSVEERASKLRKEGVEYKLRVIPGTGGKLELVEQEPRRTGMLRWAHFMLISGF